MAGSRNRRRKMPAFDTFNPFDAFVKKIATQYRLGPKGRSLVRETLDLITEEPGGVGGFVDRFKTAGLATQVASRLGLAHPAPLTGQEVEQALGSEVIGRIADKAGVSQDFATTLLRNTIPSIIGLLMESGFSDEPIPPPASISNEVVQPASIGDQVAPPEPDHIPLKHIPLSAMAESRPAPPRGRLLVPGATLLIVLGVAGYFAVRGTVNQMSAGSGTVVAQVAPAAPANQPAPSQTPSAAAAAPNTPPTVASTAPSVPAGALSPGAAGADSAAPKTAAASPEVTAGLGDKKAIAPPEAALKLPAIYFSSSSVKVPPASKAALAQVAHLLKELPGGSVVWIDGYTNRPGNPTSGINLSQRRANAVRQALVNAGVNPAILIAKGYGRSPATSNKETTEGRASVNMKSQPRVEFRIVEQEQQN
jgi:outer membrane protein OmpA-like peptidoglycan-associated protein